MIAAPTPAQSTKPDTEMAALVGSADQCTQGGVGVSDDGPDVHNVFDGRADVVLQAGSVHGDVHVHTGRVREAPRLVPVPTPHFINQRRVLAEADAALEIDVDRPRILVLTGSPGVGKREAARYWLHRHSADFPDGQFHADLSSARDVDGLVSGKLREFLLAAGIDPSAVPDTVDGRAACFRSWSSGKRVAVVVDHALAPSQVRLLTPGPGRSVVLVTAAQDLDALRVRDLTTFIDLAPLEHDFAVDLLGRLAGAQRVAAEPDAARELVDRCAGLPIALCVVGGLLNTRRSRRPGGVARLAGELRDERARLAALAVDADLSVVAVFNTAYQRLSPVAQRCHRVLGVHPGAAGRSEEVLRAMLAGEDPTAAVDELVAAGLVAEEPDGGRYRQHPLIRLHADGLTDAAERSETLTRIFDHYVPRALRAGHSVIPGRGWLVEFFGAVPGEPETAEEGMRWLRAERENLRALIDPLAAAGRVDDLRKLAIALWPLHERDKQLDDLTAFNEAALSTARGGGHDGLGALYRIQLAFAHLHRGDPAAARGWCEIAVTDAASVSLPTLEATAVETLGLVLLALGEDGGAEELLRRSLAMAVSVGDVRRLALARFHLAKVCPVAEAVPLLADALAGFTDPAVSDRYNAAKTRWWLGRRLTDLGRVAAARAELDEALAVMLEAGMVYDQARILESLGDLAVVAGDAATAVQRFEASVAITESCGFLADAERVRRKMHDVPPPAQHE
jgi:tetratricopeptide (TPR) repeat protein